MMTVLIPLIAILAGASDETAQRLEEANSTASEVAKQGLVQVAEERGVEVDAERVSYATVGSSFIVHGPIEGADTRTKEDFARGVDVMVVYIGGEDRPFAPKGFYVVRAVVPLGATKGRAQFIDETGAVVGTSQLVVRTLDEERAFLPDPENPEPLGIPNVTSTHIFKNGKRYVDCAGWTPYRVIYYEV